MTLTVIGIVAVLVFGLIGYIRGIWRMLIFFAALIAAALVAKPISSVLEGVVGGLGFIPRTFRPLAAMITTALLLFTIFLILGSIPLRLREKRRKASGLATKENWERRTGALIGAVWGFALMVLVTVGIQIIGTAEEAMMRASGVYVRVGPAASDRNISGMKVKGQSVSEMKGSFAQLKAETMDTLFGRIADKVNPLDEVFWETFQNLVSVLSDPELFAAFRNHPDIARFADNPKFIAVAEDTEIQALINQSRYYELLDHPKIAALAQDPEIYRELKSIDFGRILREIISGSRAGVERE